jgi:hypothetical protein
LENNKGKKSTVSASSNPFLAYFELEEKTTMRTCTQNHYRERLEAFLVPFFMMPLYKKLLLEEELRHAFKIFLFVNAAY